MTGLADSTDESPPGERQLTRGEKLFWYGLAAVSYIVASIVHKGLSNWFVGPMWLVAVIWFGPMITDAVRGRNRRGAL